MLKGRWLLIATCLWIATAFRSHAISLSANFRFSCATSHPAKLSSFIKTVIIKTHGWNFQLYSRGNKLFLDDNASLNFRVDGCKDG